MNKLSILNVTEFCFLLLFEQFLLRNPVSILFVVIFCLIWKTNFPLPTMDEENEKVHSAYREEMNRCYRIKMSGSAHLLKALINSIRGKKNSTENANLV